jgi:hypothetical protein
MSYKRRLGRRRLQRFVRLSHSASMENSMFNQILREISRRDILHSPKYCFGMGTIGLYLRTPSQAVEIYWCAEGYRIVLEQFRTCLYVSPFQFLHKLKIDVHNSLQSHKIQHLDSSSHLDVFISSMTPPPMDSASLTLQAPVRLRLRVSLMSIQTTNSLTTVAARGGGANGIS